MVRMVRSGGGYNSSVVKREKAYKTEPKSRAANVEGVAQVGLSHQFTPKPMLEGKGYEPKGVGPTGCPGEYNAKTSGPGSMRTTYRSGSQSQYGEPARGAVNRSPDPPATAPGRDILSDYGSEMKRR